MFILHDRSRSIHDNGGGRIYGVFTTADKAKAYVKDVLGKDVEWSDPKNTVTGSMSSRPPGKRLSNDLVNFQIKPAPVDPEEFLNLPLGF